MGLRRDLTWPFLLVVVVAIVVATDLFKGMRLRSERMALEKVQGEQAVQRGRQRGLVRKMDALVTENNDLMGEWRAQAVEFERLGYASKRPSLRCQPHAPDGLLWGNRP